MTDSHGTVCHLRWQGEGGGGVFTQPGHLLCCRADPTSLPPPPPFVLPFLPFSLGLTPSFLSPRSLVLPECLSVCLSLAPCGPSVYVIAPPPPPNLAHERKCMDRPDT